MADAGIGDILIANQIVGAAKMARLVALRRRSDVIVAVDSPVQVAALDTAARQAGVVLRVLVEVDIGNRRAGVSPGSECVALARAVAESPALRFAGVTGWEGHTAAIADPREKGEAITTAVGQLVHSADMCREAGLPPTVVSCGGTGTYRITVAQRGVTEIQAGGGVFGDVHYEQNFGVPHALALRVLTTVTSRPNATRIVCDAGKKAMSGDAALPRPVGLVGVASVRLSAEHAVVELTHASESPGIGDLLEFEVGYSDTTVHLHEFLHAMRGRRIVATWAVRGRGKLQ